MKTIVVILLLCIVASMLGPCDTRHDIRESQLRTMCKHNVQLIASGLEMYRDDYKGQLPPSIDLLVTGDYHAWHKGYVCPSYRKAHSRQVAKLMKRDPAGLLRTSYRYLHPPQERAGLEIVMEEIFEHPAAAWKSLPAGRHVITRELRVRFVPTRRPEPTEQPSTR